MNRHRDTVHCAARASFAALVSCTLLALAPPRAAAQDVPVTQPGWNQYLASELVGVPVLDAVEDQIGVVRDLVTSNGRRVTGIVVRLDEIGLHRDVLVSYSSALIGAVNRTYDGRGAAQAGAARDPRSFGRRDQDPQAFADDRETYGRILPAHVRLPRLTEEDLESAPAWPLGAWNGTGGATRPGDAGRLPPRQRQITFSAIQGLPAHHESGRLVGEAQDLLVDRDGSIEAYILDRENELQRVAVDRSNVGFEIARPQPGGALTRPRGIVVTGGDVIDLYGRPGFSID